MQDKESWTRSWSFEFKYTLKCSHRLRVLWVSFLDNYPHEHDPLSHGTEEVVVLIFAKLSGAEKDGVQRVRHAQTHQCAASQIWFKHGVAHGCC